MEPTGTSRPAARTLRQLGLALKLALAGTLVACCLGYGLLFALGLKPLVMLTGSMGDTIPVGSLVIDREVPPSSLRVGDVITFQKPIGARGLDTHRITAIRRSVGHTTYRTQGDANHAPDPWSIEFRSQDTANRVVLSVPHLGWALLYLRTPLVRTLILGAIALSLLCTFLKALAADVVSRRPKATPGLHPDG